MTKDERIAALERLVSDLSRRVQSLEARPPYVYYPQYPQTGRPIWYGTTAGVGQINTSHSHSINS